MHTVVFHVFPQVGRQLWSGGPRHADEVFDARRFVHLSAHPVCHECHVEPLARRIDGGCGSGGPASGHDEVEALRPGCCHGLGSESAFELSEQVAQRSPSDVECLSVCRDGRYGLYAEMLCLFGPEGAVGYVVRDAGMVEGDEVERLHHVRAVRAGERDVGDQMDGAVEGADAGGCGGVGQVFPFSVGIEQGQQQRTEFVAARHGAEADACRVAVAEQVECQAVAVERFGVDVVRRGSHGTHQVEELVA